MIFHFLIIYSVGSILFCPLWLTITGLEVIKMGEAIICVAKMFTISILLITPTFNN